MWESRKSGAEGAEDPAPARRLPPRITQDWVQGRRWVCQAHAAMPTPRDVAERWKTTTPAWQRGSGRLHLRFGRSLQRIPNNANGGGPWAGGDKLVFLVRQVISSVSTNVEPGLPLTLDEAQ